MSNIKDNIKHSDVYVYSNFLNICKWYVDFQTFDNFMFIF